MRQLLLLFFVTVLAAACSEQQKHNGPPYENLKPELSLTSKQEKQFDEITLRYNKIRAEEFAAARAGGKMNREAMLAKMRNLFEKQAAEVKPLLNDEQFAVYTEWIEHNIPGRIGWSPELIEKIKTNLNLTDDKAAIVDAVNEAFIEAYSGAHDNYHGNAEAAKSYWTEFNNNRNAALKEAFSEEEYQKFLEITKDVRFKGEHGKGK
ncbi:hypothetical protein SAMN05444274_102196 [Mariniphaga anaerophila]|uniref:Uncharacterized protein n=1 Tax=Mariniphaga anaerophila TaxID=1484053 RepID=A0A1M4VSV8_9BACT|nr:hypothetical protein [Mariniphaga anaerophila]SHE71955.1 hypothetical protein SAMN05444274_102196 [Mariniphaga anaerophila]